MNKIVEILKKRREIVMYLIFGVLTTVVSWGVYFVLMASGRAVFDIAPDDASSTGYFAVYTASQLISWVCAVLFAFFTNRAWVFTDSDRSVGIWKQLVSFSAGRLVTLGLDYVITYAGARALLALFPALADVGGLNLADIGAKLAASVVVLVGNYIFSKIFVFKRKKDEKTGG